MKTPIKLVLFDMDDVLCTYDWHRRTRLLSRIGGLPKRHVEAAIWTSGFEDSADRGEIDAVTYLSGFGARAGLSLSRAAWVANRRASMTPDHAMLDLVQRLKASTAVALLTNNGHLTFDTMPELFPQMIPLFGERLTVSAMFGTAKPDPAIYVRALERLGFAAAQTVFVDDKPENAAGARQAGLSGHCFTGIEALKAHLQIEGVRL